MPFHAQMFSIRNTLGGMNYINNKYLLCVCVCAHRGGGRLKRDREGKLRGEKGRIIKEEAESFSKVGAALCRGTEPASDLRLRALVC